MRSVHYKYMLTVFGLALFSLACSPCGPVALLSQIAPTPTSDVIPTAMTKLATFTVTPTWTVPPPTSTDTPALLPDTPVPPTATLTPQPTEEPIPTSIPDPPTATAEPLPSATVAAPTESAPVDPTADPAAGDADVEEDVTYRIVHYRVLGEGENNGGIFDKGGQHLIFLTVLDQQGNGLDGVVVKDSNGSELQVVTGSKGPGKAEISMEWDPYRLYVASDPSGPTTSEVSNQMNTAFPHIPDVVGKLGDINNEYSVCPTADVRCSPPFYNVHFSYEIAFQKVR